MSLFLSLNPQPVFNVGSTSGQGSNSAISTTSANIAVSPGNAYRLIANSDCYFRVSKAANTPIVAATTQDVFLPKGSPMVLIASDWDQISAIAATGTGTLGVMRVQLPI
jgi:hypothetical protein